MRTDRVLHPGAEPADDERAHQHRKAGAGSRDQKADARQRGAEAEHQRAAETLGDGARRYLKPGHRADIERPQQPDLGIAEPELGLPQRQQHVQQVGVAVMQHMRAAGDRHRAPLRRGDLAQGGCDQRHRRRLFLFYDGNVQNRMICHRPVPLC